MILPLRMATGVPVPIVKEVSEKEVGERSGPAVSEELFGPGFFQPIGQKGLRASAASKVADY